jgi:hypothetical protein
MLFSLCRIKASFVIRCKKDYISIIIFLLFKIKRTTNNIIKTDSDETDPGGFKGVKDFVLLNN